MYSYQQKVSISSPFVDMNLMILMIILITEELLVAVDLPEQA